MASGLDIVEGEVRELVRRRGLDPVLESSAVRRLIDEVIADYRDRSVTSSLPPLAEGVARLIFDSVAGFGPLQPFLDDRSIEEIWINDRLTYGFHRIMGEDYAQLQVACQQASAVSIEGVGVS